LPGRFVAEAFGCKVEWTASYKKISVTF
jgi:hypothetical protein